MSVRILVGDCREQLRTLPDQSVNCCVTSPPYFGLRDYGVAGQMGLEPTLAEYISGMVEVFRDVHRVLRDDGTLWLNIGDSFASSSAGGNQGISGQRASRTFTAALSGGRIPSGLKAKDLMMVPARLALALQDDGWWLRSDIIWAKPNPMPESVTDRPTSAHEHIFLLTKSARYWYDADAVAESAAQPFGIPKQTAQHKAMDARGNGASERTTLGSNQGAATRNQRNVWTITPKPFKGAHFAVFPPEIPERCIKAGCPVGGVVLDPFAGSGTTLMVAHKLGRNGIGIELNPDYAEMARHRITNDAPMFATVVLS